MRFFFSTGKHWLNLQSYNKTGRQCGKERYLKQPDVPVELQELIPVKNTLPHISFGWEWSEACEASGSEQGGRPEATGSFDVDWCMTVAPVPSMFSFPPEFLPDHEKGLL